MPTITVIDSHGKEHNADVEYGATLFDACRDAGVELPHSCGLGAWCGTCAVHILKAAAKAFSHLDEEEIETCTREGITLADPEAEIVGDPKAPVGRLSCCVQMFDDVTVKQPGDDAISEDD
jgi:ferredoxin